MSLLVTSFPSPSLTISMPLVVDDNISWVPALSENQVMLGSGRPDTKQLNTTALSSETEIVVGDIVGLGTTEGD